MTGVRAVSGKAGVQRWVNPRNVTVKERIYCPDIELLSVGFHAFYAPREFPYTVFIVVYITPRAAPTTTCDVIHDAIARMQTQHPEAFIAITEDYNYVSLSSCLTGFVQYVDCPTCGERTFDLFYATVKEAYSLIHHWVDLITAWSLYNQHTGFVYKDFLLLPDLSGSGHQRRVMH